MGTPYPTEAVVEQADLSLVPDAFPRLPGRDFLVSKTPSWSTTIRRSSSQREVRVSNVSSPDWVFRLRHEFLRDADAHPEIGELLGFFNSRMGRFGFFYYQDETDYQVTSEGFGTGDGTTTEFQLRRVINIGGVRTAIEPVRALWEAPVISVGGSVVSSANYTLKTWGRVQFNTAPALNAALSWTGKFLFVCRFEQDEMDMEQLAQRLWSQSGLTFRSIRP